MNLPRRLATATLVALILSNIAVPAVGAYRILDLGYLPGFVYAEARGINNLNTVVGTLRSAGSGIGERGFRWTPTAGMEDLGPASAIGQINDAGVTAGVSIEGKPALWGNDGQMSLLAMPSGSALTYAHGISNTGYVAGVALFPNTSLESQGCVWSPEGIPSLLRRLAPDRATNASGVNDDGVTVGSASDDVTGLMRPVAWSRTGELLLLDAPTGDGHATAVTNDGYAFGYTWTDSRSDTIATVWAPDGSISALLPPPAGYSSSAILGANQGGQKVGVVGGATEGNVYEQSSVVWQASGELTVLPSFAGAHYSQAHAINDSGWAAGVAQDAAGSYHAVVWEPVPEPSTFAALLAGLGFGMLSRWRRSGLN